MTDSAKAIPERLHGLLAVRHPNELRGGYTGIVMSPDEYDQKIIEAFKLGLGAAESAICTQKVAQAENIVPERRWMSTHTAIKNGTYPKIGVEHVLLQVIEELWSAESALKVSRESTGWSGRPRWFEMEVKECIKNFHNERCDSEDLCAKHHAIAVAGFPFAQSEIVSLESAISILEGALTCKNETVIELSAALSTQNEEMMGQELELRRMMWLGHGHCGIYGDDGEMQCSECARFGCWDYLRSPLEDVRKSYNAALADRLRAALAQEQGGKS